MGRRRRPAAGGSAMVAIVSLIVVLVLSLVVVRVATIALTLTGLSRELARFQARSAFTGAGFTTNESENVVGHPLRRRIIMLLMLLGNAGIVTAVGSLILSFADVREAGGLTGRLWFRVTLLVAGLSALLYVAQSGWVDRWMSRLITWALARFTSLEVRDYAGLLHLTGDYAVSELQVEAGDWIADRKLTELRLNHEGILVLGVERARGRYVGAPRGDTLVRPGDTLLLYGREKVLADLDQRQAGPDGSRRHVEAVTEHAARVEAEQAEDRAAQEKEQEEERRAR